MPCVLEYRHYPARANGSLVVSFTDFTGTLAFSVLPERKMMPLMLTSIANLAISAVLFYGFIYGLGVGFTGAAIALTIANFIQMLLNLAAAKHACAAETWPRYSARDAFDRAGALELLRCGGGRRRRRWRR